MSARAEPIDARGAVRWLAPELSERPTPAAPASAPGPSVGELESIERAAREEGLQRGHQEGYAQGLAQAQGEMRRLQAQLEGLLDSFSRPLAQLDAELQGVLCELATQVAGVLVGRAYETEPALLAELVEEALRSAGSGAREAEVRLHPDDLAAVQPLLADTELPRARLSPDPGLARGDVRVHTESLRLDGTLCTRLRAALAAFKPDRSQP